MTSISVVSGPPPEAVTLPGVFTVDTLPTPSESNYGMLAKVSDLFGQKRGYVMCQRYASTYAWEPPGDSPAVTMSGNQDITFLPLKMPSIIILDGTLTANRSLNLTTDKAYPGMKFEVKFVGGLGLFGLNLTGLLSGPLSLLLNQQILAVFDASGSWKRLN